ncbi:S8 family serine peptidase [Desulfofundulus sp. TPOSR]|uniref:S8 family serine peptidase n=1 Tax=Desulfofundulus sp. TPOSR TaxID=2714340 RepID=UPI001408A3CD|nr:S8 family serine peptidase [Desulfofundulus sp. TPOSR]NHM26459.1 S8 family serine peptidase [Desulfofundulus sp. TPOSR]
MKLVLPGRRPAARPSLYVLVFLAVCFLFGGPAGVAMAKGVTGPPAAETYGTDRIIVKFKPGKNYYAAPADARAMRHMRRAYSIKVPGGEKLETVMDVYRSRSDVELVQPDYIRQACLLPATVAGENWGIARTGADKLSQRVTGNSEAVVAVVDSGVDARHPLLYGRVLPGYDFANGDDDAADDNGHGTHIAGIIAMEAGNQRVRILPVKVLDSSGKGYDSDIADGIYYAVDHGADVINLSIGGPGRSPVLEEAVNYAVSRGVVVVAAAGNSSADASGYSPAGIQACITVSAVDRNDTITKFSNYGTVVDIAAPGKDIVSSVPLDADTDGILDGYTSYDGTSMAAAFVSGIAALLRVNDGSITVQQVENAIALNADDAGEKGRDPYYGFGIINFSNYLINEPVSLKILAPSPFVAQGNRLSVSYAVYGTFSGYARFRVDGLFYGSQKVPSAGCYNTVLNVEALAKGMHTLAVELLDNTGKTVAGGQAPFVVPSILDDQFAGWRVLGSARENIPLDHTFTVKFSLPIDEKTVTGESLQLYRYDTAQPVAVIIRRIDDFTFQMRPQEALEPATRYWVVVRPSIRSRAGFNLKEGVVAHFVTVQSS